MSEPEIMPPRPPLYCSFCGKSDNDVEKIIAGPTVFICNECVDLCSSIVHEAPAEPPLAEAGACELHRRPPLTGEVLRNAVDRLLTMGRGVGGTQFGEDIDGVLVTLDATRRELALLRSLVGVIANKSLEEAAGISRQYIADHPPAGP